MREVSLVYGGGEHWFSSFVTSLRYYVDSRDDSQPLHIQLQGESKELTVFHDLIAEVHTPGSFIRVELDRLHLSGEAQEMEYWLSKSEEGYRWSLHVKCPNFTMFRREK